ncbi:ATP-binding cassette domain-containing protein [Dactylosporangium sp. NPDC000555]|uniref:ABC transporter ATP-binding protein n=1 Tax=Dactylosporangium sp. NPDC000555 TaxID=3154260 RepID=UPI003324A917
MIIEVSELRRHFKKVAAVDGLTFGVDRGAAVGYIGANGAGKSTTIKMLTGILRPTSGTVRTCGLEPLRQRRRLARRIGVVFGQRSQLWWDLPLRDSYRALGAIHRIDHRPRLAELAERLDLVSFLNTPVRQLSLGQRIRGEVAAALLHAPELLILDEPTIGLDVLSKERLRAFLVEQRAAFGTSLLLATHDMGDVRRLTERILLVDHGRLAYDGTLDGLARHAGAERILVLDLAEPAAPLDAVPGTRLVGVEAGGLRQRLSFAPGGTTVAAILAAVAATAQVHDLTIEEPDIEAVVRELYQAPGGASSAGSPPEFPARRDGERP